MTAAINVSEPLIHRRRWGEFVFLFFIAGCALLVGPTAAAATKTAQQTPQHNQRRAAVSSFVVELTAQNLTSNLEYWERDLAIMFYAPWCKYCKQLLPTWETIAQLSTANSNLVISTFNCEGTKAHEAICRQLAIDRYPTLHFLGYGSFNQGPQGSMIGKTSNQRLVKFVSDLYPEAVFDWVNMLSTLSGVNRRWDDVTGFFTGKSRDAQRIDRLKEQKEIAEKKAYLFSKQLEKFKANEIFDSLEDNGDPFPILNQMQPDVQNLPFRVCIGEMAQEFCKYYEEERYCTILDRCVMNKLEAEVCRPQQCPFENKRGCVVASTCLQADVIKEYKDALAPAVKSSTAKVATSLPV